MMADKMVVRKVEMTAEMMVDMMAACLVEM